MTSVASIPVYMLPGAPALPPPRSALETGDPNLATEVLPAPPTLSSVLQASGKRDPRKPVPTMSYLPQRDPGTTYAGVLTGPIIGSLESVPEVDGPRPPFTLASAGTGTPFLMERWLIALAPGPFRN